nr:MAG TPA_asm: hypothetical protein [Caudoviricetes sp.]
MSGKDKPPTSRGLEHHSFISATKKHIIFYKTFIMIC